MILDRIGRRGAYREFPELSAALAFFACIKPENFPAWQVALERGVVVNPVTLVTKPESDCRFEGHRLFADVHFIVEGAEEILVCDEAGAKPDGDFDEPHDVGFFHCSGGLPVVLWPGDFLVCFPHELHKAAIAPGVPAPCKKLVAKLPVSPE